MTIAESTIISRVLDYAWLVAVPAVIALFRKFSAINKQLSEHETQIALIKHGEEACQAGLVADAKRRDKERAEIIKLIGDHHTIVTGSIESMRTAVTKRIDDVLALVPKK